MLGEIGMDCKNLGISMTNQSSSSTQGTANNQGEAETSLSQLGCFIFDFL